MARGGPGGGHRFFPRYGYEPIGGRPIPHQQDVIGRLIAAMPQNGGEGDEAVCRQLNAQRIPGPTGDGWERSAARYIARREQRVRQATRRGLVALPQVDTGRSLSTGDRLMAQRGV
jgi:hypothetical protein